MRLIARFFALTILLTLPLAAQPFQLAPSPIGPTPGDVLGGSAASNGKLYLAAWSEVREGLVQIRGTRIATNGAPVEAESFRISPASDTAGEGLVSPPAVASDGKNFVVVWASRSHLFTAFVPAIGDPRVLATTIDARNVHIVWSSTAYVVLRETSVSGLAATLVDFDGTLLFDGVAVATSPRGITTPSLAVNKDGKAMALWLDSTDGDAHVADVTVDRVLSGGVSSNILQSPRPVYGSAGAIGSDGTDFLAVWTAYPASGNNFSILARPLDANGAPSGPVQTVNPSANPLTDPFLFWNGQKYLLIDSTGPVMAQALNANGTPTPDGPYVITTHSGSVKDAEALVAGDLDGTTKTFLVWRDFRFGHGEFFGQAGDLNALPTTDEIVVSRSQADQVIGGSAWTGSDYLTVWTESAGVARIVAARANDRVPIVIANPQLTGSTPGGASVAAAGGKALIAWVDVAIRGIQQTTLYRSILANGAQTASQPSLVTTDVRNNETPSVATNGQTFAIAWTTLAGEIAATTVDSSGNTVTQPITLTVKPSDTFTYSAPKLAWIGSSYVLVRTRTFNDGRNILELQRLSADLTLLGGTLALTDNGTSTGVSVAGSSAGAVIAWVQHTIVGSSTRAARFSAANTLLDPINGISIASGEPEHGPAAGWDGKSWRIGVDSLIFTLPTIGGVQQVQSIPLASRIAAITSGGPRTFIAFDVEDHVDLTVRAFGQFVNEVPVRHRAVGH
ncbi:MAG: hypothetical protein QOE82_1796 [Thermoanaerobaculia bacterium]|jgi:hypothetical protein|nr:hypothetical protein [Thermoanaerobaculia bacterium]